MDLRASETDQSERVKSVIGSTHIVDVYDGTLGRIFTCERCKRRLPESSFPVLGPRFLKSAERAIIALHPHCKTCRKQQKGKWTSHELYSPKLARFWDSYTSQLRGGARARSIFFSVDADDLLGKYLEQDGYCALSGIKMDPFKGGSGRKSGKPFTVPSADRIDSKKHYTIDNIQIVASAVNIMKNDIPNAVFIELCAEIARRNNAF